MMIEENELDYLKRSEVGLISSEEEDNNSVDLSREGSVKVNTHVLDFGNHSPEDTREKLISREEEEEDNKDENYATDSDIDDPKYKPYNRQNKKKTNINNNFTNFKNI